jgi:hypothetical protein
MRVTNALRRLGGHQAPYGLDLTWVCDRETFSDFVIVTRFA